MNKLVAAFFFCLSPLAFAHVLETEALRIEQGKTLAAGKEMRVWHFEEFKEPMQDWPREVKGAFVELRCEDNQFSEAALILVRDDFRLRSYPAKSLAAEDRARAEKLEAARVSGNARIEDFAVVRQSAKVGDHAIVGGHVTDTRNATFDLQLAWKGGAAGQRVFEFGDADASVLLAIVQGGRPAFLIHRGKEFATLQSTSALVVGKWTRVTITLQEGIARLYLDGKLAVENKKFALTPEDVRARAGRIGAGVAGIGFVGKIDDFAVYRTGFDNFGNIPTAPNTNP